MCNIGYTCHLKITSACQVRVHNVLDISNSLQYFLLNAYETFRIIKEFFSFHINPFTFELDSYRFKVCQIRTIFNPT